MSARIRTAPANVIVEEGHVVLDGPQGLAVTFTAEAARETAGRLEAAATLAELQQGFALNRPPTLTVD